MLSYAPHKTSWQTTQASCSAALKQDYMCLTSAKQLQCVLLGNVMKGSSLFNYKGTLQSAVLAAHKKYCLARHYVPYVRDRYTLPEFMLAQNSCNGLADFVCGVKQHPQVSLPTLALQQHSTRARRQGLRLVAADVLIDRVPVKCFTCLPPCSTSCTGSPSVAELRTTKRRTEAVEAAGGTAQVAMTNSFSLWFSQTRCPHDGTTWRADAETKSSAAVLLVHACVT